MFSIWNNLDITFLQLVKQIRKALPRKSFLNIGREKHPTLRSQNTMYASWDSGRGQRLAVIFGIHLFKQCHQHFWVADVCFEAGPGDEHTLPFDKGKGGSWRKAGLWHTAGLFQRLQGDCGEVLGCFHCRRREQQMWQGGWLSHALGCSSRQRRKTGTGSREIAFGRQERKGTAGLWRSANMPYLGPWGFQYLLNIILLILKISN